MHPDLYHRLQNSPPSVAVNKHLTCQLSSLTLHITAVCTAWSLLAAVYLFQNNYSFGSTLVSSSVNTRRFCNWQSSRKCLCCASPQHYLIDRMTYAVRVGSASQLNLIQFHRYNHCLSYCLSVNFAVCSTGLQNCLFWRQVRATCPACSHPFCMSILLHLTVSIYLLLLIDPLCKVAYKVTRLLYSRKGLVSGKMACNVAHSK